MTIPVDFQYCDIISKILTQGTVQKDRTSVGSSKQLFGEQIMFDTKGKYVPFIQCRSFGPKTSFYEWKWMMNGLTDSRWLEDRGVYFWSDHTTREFLDSRGLALVPDKSVGKSYGYQFRNFNGIDQLRKVYNNLKNDPTSRRHIISIWNVSELDQAPLEPCSFLYEFMYDDGTLHLHQHMRSADITYGVPYNMSFGSYLLFSFAKALGYKTGKYWLTMTNCHIYNNQENLAEEILLNFYKNKMKYNNPKMTIEKEIKALNDVLSMEYTDIRLEEWVKGPEMEKVEMAK